MTQANKSNLKDPDSQKVEVVVQSPEGEVNIFGELSILVLRVSFSLLMVHHGLEKLNDPGGFAEFVVGKYFSFLPGDPVIWTYMAAVTQIICPIGLATGVLARLSSLGLLSTMVFALYFHFMLEVLRYLVIRLLPMRSSSQRSLQQSVLSG